MVPLPVEMHHPLAVTSTYIIEFIAKYQPSFPGPIGKSFPTPDSTLMHDTVIQLHAKFQNSDAHAHSSMHSIPFIISHRNTPNASPTTNTQPVTTLARQPTLWRPANIPNLVIALPACGRALAAGGGGVGRWIAIGALTQGGIFVVDKIPDQD